ncbi:MAG: HYR domain-containing protein, partial [Cyclobacteriaceae bacterium]|nr:HYR domain-containing protein [Cyclobacteriaceae bacterium]
MGILNLIYTRVVFTIALCFLTAFTHAQKPDSKGREFWLAFPANLGIANLTLFISSETITNGNVSIPGISFNQTFSVSPGVITSITLPSSIAISTSNVIENKGIYITANDEITIYGLNRLPYTTDAYLALPVDILGTQYLSIGYKGGFNGGEYFSIVATQNNTTVTIIPKISTSGKTAGIPYSINLNQGQTYQLKAFGGDLSGSIISSTAPIAVLGGNVCANVPINSTACDHLIEQLTPIDSWGKSFVTVPLKSRRGDTFRILASENNTTLTIDHNSPVLLNKGQYYETILYNAAVINADKPLLVTQYSNGSSFDGVNADPFMMLIPPYEQYEGKYTVTTPASGFSRNYINLVSPSTGIGSITINSNPISSSQFTRIGNTDLYSAQIDINSGTYQLNGTQPFGAFVYGFDNYDSYGYPGGTSLAPIASISSLEVIAESNTTSEGNQYCINATVLDQFNEPLEGIRVDMNISGANNLIAFGNTDANGRVTICYTPLIVGTDNLLITAGSLSQVLQNEVTSICLEDKESPVISGSDATIFTDIDQCSASVTLSTLIEITGLNITDNCLENPIPLFSVGENRDELVFPALFTGTSTVYINAADELGNQAIELSVNITVADNLKPSLEAPAEIIATADQGKCFATIIDLGSFTAVDNCDFTVSNNAPENNQFNKGETIIRWVATDISGNETEAFQKVIVNDDESPIITSFPENQTIATITGTCGGIVIFDDPTATDNCGPVTITRTDNSGLSSGSIFSIGTTQLSYDFTDESGNTVSRSFSVTVSDEEAPVFDDVQNIEVTADIGACSKIVEYPLPRAFDNCESSSSQSSKNVLILYDVINSNTESLKKAIEDAGHFATYSNVPEYQFNGTNPSLDNFDVVIHLAGTSYSLSIPQSGQEALLDFVIQKGKTYITEEWSAYRIDALGQHQSLKDITVLKRNSGIVINATYTVNNTHANNPILQGIPSSFTLPSGGTNIGNIRDFQTNPPKVLMTFEYGDALAVRYFDSGGMAIGMAHAGNYINSAILSDENIQKIYI